MRETKLTLDGTEFAVPALNLGQLERVSAVIAAGTGSASGFAVVKIALERATPTPDFETLAPTVDEIGSVVQAILQMSGLQKPDGNPQPAAEPTANP